jgi:hypothetical protein
MSIDRRVYEPMLRQTERDLVALDEEKMRLMQDIGRLQRKAKRLDSQRNLLVRARGSVKVMLQMPLTSEEAQLCGVEAESQRSYAIPEDAFKGLTLPEAAKKLLGILGRAATHREMVDGLRKGGVAHELKHLENSLRSAMQRRPDLFVFIKEEGNFGQWELVEWNELPAENLTESIAAERPALVAVPSVPLAAQA